MFPCNNLAICRAAKGGNKEKTSLKGGTAGSRERVFHWQNPRQNSHLQPFG
jgi:hypothetical protein